MTALVILNYNNSADTRNCIESILRFNTAPVKFIIVDNASRPDEREALLRVLDDTLPGYVPMRGSDNVPASPKLPYATLIETGSNIGYGRGNNTGLKLAYADPDISDVMILNNDIIFVEDIIPRLLDVKASLSDCAIISPVLYKKGLKEYDYNCARRNVKVTELIGHNFLHYLRQLLGIHRLPADKTVLKNADPGSRLIEIELPSGSCMLVDKEFFRGIGSFDPATFLYFEENILYKKISATGRRNYLCLDCRCIHLGAATTTNIPDNKWLVTQAKDSERYYVRRYSGASAPLRWIHTLSVHSYMIMYTLQKKLKR